MPNTSMILMEKHEKLFRSRAAQALAPRVEYWNLRFIWNLVLGIWDLYI